MTKQEFMAMSQNKDLCLLREFDNKVYTLYGMSGKNTIEAVIIENNIEYSALLAYGDCQIDDDEKFKIIARPLSDLTKPIEHKGEVFVPIVELAKMIYPNHEWRISSCGLYAVVGNGYMTFEYDYGYNCFLCNNSAQLDQLECLLKVIEWHFDIAGLIEKGEAIDVNTLETNPYK